MSVLNECPVPGANLGDRRRSVTYEEIVASATWSLPKLVWDFLLLFKGQSKILYLRPKNKRTEKAISFFGRKINKNEKDWPFSAENET